MMFKNNKRIQDKMDHGWMFHRGDIEDGDIKRNIWNIIKAGLDSGLTDYGRYNWEEPVSYIDEPQELDLQKWSEVDFPHDWLIEQSFTNDLKIAPFGLNNGYVKTANWTVLQTELQI